jgi:hypothetical protein
VGWCLGALMGSWLVDALPSRITIGQYSHELSSNLPLVFFVSGLLRLAVSSSFLRTFHEARAVEQAPFTQLVWELPLLKPLAQLLASPLRASK